MHAELVVAPGLVDVSARLREPGLEYKATLESEMSAAIAGGVTSLACPPDTDPPLDEPGLVEMLKHRARSLNQARVYPIGALTVGLAGESLTEMAELAEAGCVAFSQADIPLVDTDLLWRAMQYASTFGFPLWLRASDPHIGRNGIAHDGEIATRLGLAGIPVMAETIALSTILTLARNTGVRVHLCRLSSADGVALVRAAKREGLPVTCDVAIHHLHLSDVDIGWFDPHARLVPPLRSTRDRAALRAGVADGTIDVVCSDHAPVDDDDKQVPFGEAAPGATGLELLLPLTLKWRASSNSEWRDCSVAFGRAVTVAAGRRCSVNSTLLAPLLACPRAPGSTFLCVRPGRGNGRSSRPDAATAQPRARTRRFAGYEIERAGCVYYAGPVGQSCNRRLKVPARLGRGTSDAPRCAFAHAIGCDRQG
jgi:dihydroorotase